MGNKIRFSQIQSHNYEPKYCTIDYKGKFEIENNKLLTIIPLQK